MILAFGLDAYGLRRFAAEHGAQTTRGLGWVDDWRQNVVLAMMQADTSACWSLDGVDVSGGLLRAAGGGGGATDWELFTFRQNEAWWDRTTWWLDAAECENPFIRDTEADGRHRD